MNVILFAPALFLVLLESTGITSTFIYIALCGWIQLIIGYPFLMHNPYGYLLRSFELVSVILYKNSIESMSLLEVPGDVEVLFAIFHSHCYLCITLLVITFLTLLMIGSSLFL